DSLKLRVASAVIRMMVSIHHVLDRLIGQLFHFSDDVIGIDFELVVNQENAFVGDQDRRVTRNHIVVDDIQIILNFHDIQFGGSLLGVDDQAENAGKQQRKVDTKHRVPVHGGEL